MKRIFKEQIGLLTSFLIDGCAINCTIDFDKDGVEFRIFWDGPDGLHWVVRDGEDYEYVTQGEHAASLWEQWQSLIREFSKEVENGDAQGS
jgi:hypothetical protein